MHGWRGRVGYICPSVWSGDREWRPLLPEGVDMMVVTLGVQSLVPQELEGAAASMEAAAQQLAARGCGCIIAGGSPVLSLKGPGSDQELITRLREITGLPVTTTLTAALEALRYLSIQRLVLVSPYEAERNEERRRFLEAAGFTVVHERGLGLRRNVDFANLPSYASYRLAREAFQEAPEADGLYISCAEWEVSRNIQRLEQDLGRPVVAATQASCWWTLNVLKIHEPVRGYGRLMETT